MTDGIACFWVRQKRGVSPHNSGTSQTSEAGTAADGDDSGQLLYSVSSGQEQLTRQPGKDLDKCARLLAGIMQAAPGLITRQNTGPKSSKMFVSKVRKTKCGKPTAVVKTRKVCERSSKAAVTRKVAPKAGSRGKTMEHAVDSVSETSTELQVRLAGPKPLPLNNSETVSRLLGIHPNTGPQIQPGWVVMTKVPYNERILSSTPMSSPAANRHRGYSMYSDNSGTSAKVMQPQPVLAQTSHAHPPGPVTAAMTHPRLHPQACPHSVPAVGGVYAESPHGELHESPGGMINNAQIVDVMKRYVTQSDEHLTSFIQTCLSQGQVTVPNTQQVVSQTGSSGHSGSRVQSGSLGHGHLGTQGQDHSTKCMSSLQMTDLRGSGMQGVSMAESSPELSEFQQRSVDANGTDAQPHAESSGDVDIDAILRSHGIELGGSQASVGLKTQPDDGMASAPLVNGLNEKENLPLDTLGNIPQQVPENIATFRNPAKDVAPEAKLEEKPQKLKRSPGKTSRKEKEKDKTRKKMAIAARGALPLEKPSPADTKTQVRTLLYLFGELRAATSVSRDPDVGRLLEDMSQTLGQLTPGLATSGMSTDLDLALQPLRSENAQLRRRLRILNQQFRDKCDAVSEAVKPDPNFQVVHLELQRHTLETRLREEAEDKERLQAAVATLAQQVQGLMKERQSMVKVLSAKDTDNMRSQQDWIGEASGLRTQLKTAETWRFEMEAKLEEAEHEKLMLGVSLQQKTKETDRLGDLVRSLQGSMSRLLADLKGTKPHPLTAVNDISRHIENIGNLLKTDKPLESLLDMRPTHDAPASAPTQIPSSVPASVRRIAPVGDMFSTQDLIRAVPSESSEELSGDVKDGLQRAYQLLDRIDDVITPRTQTQQLPAQRNTRPSKETQMAKETHTSKEYPTKGSRLKRQHYYQKRLPADEGCPSSDTSWRSADPECDQVNDNYQGQLTQELLLEHDRQNGVDNDVIERMLVHSAHKPSVQPEQSEAITGQRQKINSMETSSKKALFSQPKAVEDAYSSLEHEIQLSLDKAPTFPMSDSGGDKQDGFSSIHSPFDMDTTEYLNPPENVKNRPSVLQDTGNRLKGASASALTVKDFLAPLAKRLYSPAGKCGGGSDGYVVNVVSPVSSELIRGMVSTDTELSSREGGTDGDDTLTRVEDGCGGPRTFQTPIGDDSRYSVTDYFKKYPIIPVKGTTIPPHAIQNHSDHIVLASRQKTAQPPTKAMAKHNLDRDSGRIQDNANGNDPGSVTSGAAFIHTKPGAGGNGSMSFTTVTSVGSASKPAAVPQNAGEMHSPQDRLYHGTELDTSLSAIQETEATMSVLSVSTVTSLSSTATVNEQDFKDGLAKLDANIARIQSSLHTQIGGYFK